MTILALEFSSLQRSVAIAREGRVLAEAVETGERGMNVFTLIEKVLAVAKLMREEIEIVAVGLGPGSYAGIRVALAIAQGWQLARGVKLLGIGSVECLVAQAQAEKLFGRVNIVLDAQRGEFYLASYEISAAGLELITPLKVATATEIGSRMGAGEILIGPEVRQWFPLGVALFPQAAMLAQLAMRRTEFKTGETLVPIYLRETNFVKASVQRMAGVKL